MIKRIKDSLAAKVFSLSLLLLIVCSFITYLLIALFMPQTYSLYLNNTLAENLCGTKQCAAKASIL